MVGKRYLKIWDKNVRYELEFKRKVTILKGDSGTGKTTLIQLIRNWYYKGNEFGIKAVTNISDLRVLTWESSWRDLLKDGGKVLFVDEGVDYVASSEFISAFNKSDCWLVVVNRDTLGRLAYSIDEVYTLVSEKRGKYTINKLYARYEDNLTPFHPDKLVTEDSGSGYELLSRCFDFSVLSSSGNSKMEACIAKLRVKNKYEKLYIIVDGAAFGQHIESLLQLISEDNNIRLFAPESIEYLILCTKLFRKFCEDELLHTEDYADTSKFLTWEQYFTSLLRKIAAEKYNSVYKKGSLDGIFLSKVLQKQLALEFKDIKSDAE